MNKTTHITDSRCRHSGPRAARHQGRHSGLHTARGDPESFLTSASRRKRLPAYAGMTAVAAAVALAVVAAPAQAQTYPQRPVRAVVPFPPGGGTDILARLLLQRLGDRLGGACVIANPAGAAGL